MQTVPPPLKMTQPSTWRWPTLNASAIYARFTALGGWLTLGELLLLALWTYLVGKRFLDFDALMWPYGGDYPLNIQNFFALPQVLKCGACVFWNGYFNGGAPTFADLFGGLLHPIIVIPSLVWGVFPGTKMAIVLSLGLAGFAQWWLARVMGLGPIARVWAGAMAVVGGHLAARFEMGHIVMVLSIASTSLIFAPAIDLVVNGNRRAIGALGLAGALALLSGQGYMQITTLMAIGPAFLVLLITPELRLSPRWKDVLWAVLLAVLISAIYWVPLAHFWSNISKSANPSFFGAQPGAYSFINLIVDDLKFYNSEALGKKPMPAFYANFIGWVPLVLVLAAVRFAPREKSRVMAFFLIAIGLVFWIGTAQPLSWLVEYIPFLAGARHPSLLTPLAVPLVLALAAWGVDRLFHLHWPRLTLNLGADTARSISLAWLVLTPFLAWGIKPAYDFSQTWSIIKLPPDLPQAAEALRSDHARWIHAFMMDFRLIPLAASQNLKINVHPDHRAWNWNKRTWPPPTLEMSVDAAVAGAANYVGQAGSFHLLQQADNYYAVVDTGVVKIPCLATAFGGDIDVTCETPASGTLTVYENNWTGWGATIDGTPSTLREGDWLSVDLPAGQHTVQFRYRPWDVYVGITLTVIGCILALAVSLWKPKPALLTSP